MKFKNIFSGIAVMSLGLLLGNIAEARINTIKLPLQTYAFKKVDCGLSVNKPEGNKYWIDPNVDLVKITRYSGTWAQGSYPNSKGVAVTRWFNMNNLLYNPNYSNWSTTASAATNVYRSYSGSATIGSIPNREPIEVVSEYNGRYQIIYVLANKTGFKMGWVPTSCIKKDVAHSVASAVTAGSGAFTAKLSSSGYAYPLGKKVTFVDRTREGYMHDYMTAVGTPIYAICDGTLTFKQRYSTRAKTVGGKYFAKYSTISYGNYAELSSGNGILARYCHLSRFWNPVANNEVAKYGYVVSDNAYPQGTVSNFNGMYATPTVATVYNVKKGQLIGYTGNTGNSSGPHLHFEVWKNGTRQQLSNYGF